MKEAKVNPSIGKLLKDLRKNKLKMTQVEFAKAIGAVQSTIYRWESGETEPTLTLEQVKALLLLMSKNGLDILHDFPSDI